MAVPAYELFSSTDALTAMALERMMAKLSTRGYAAGLEPVGATSHRFVAATESALADLLAADLSELDGTKYPLGLAEGDTENATVVRDLLADLRDRRLNTTRPILCVLDGAKALVAEVKAVFFSTSP